MLSSYWLDLSLPSPRMAKHLQIRMRMDSHHFGKLDPDPLQSQNSGAMEAQNEAIGAMDPHNGGVEAQNIAVEGLKNRGRRFASHF